MGFIDFAWTNVDTNGDNRNAWTQMDNLEHNDTYWDIRDIVETWWDLVITVRSRGLGGLTHVTCFTCFDRISLFKPSTFQN